MNKWWLLFSFSLLVFLALPVIYYPLRQSKKTFLMVVPVMIVMLMAGYFYWGALPAWDDFLQRQEKQRKVQAVLQTIKDPSQIIEKLKARLAAQPDSARGWYLLGRLYASQEQWKPAKEAFEKAHRLSPTDDAATVNYAQALWQLNQQTFNDIIRNLFNELLQKNPDQPDALAMLAMDAYSTHNYEQAISYWQHLLRLAPEQSEEAKMIRRAIAKAQQQMM
ncbi:tetratricopeptide repeat protein [Legionella clemsonensis]|uniref:Cytochrome c-type biogenesis protein CcmH n=1 Tax=Legionella clemsonensis TaxID=1867846 RepID=A0A222P3G6_9GAMM|nr:tetratricopeptide repeat protein [Legionella clemsonensis]ASQ46315.1 Cytochrome c-type biogenesis protein CcmH precursor [Legionella clemsonensis]